MTLPLCVRIDAEDQRSRQALLDDGWREIEVLETWETAIDYTHYMNLGFPTTDRFGDIKMEDFEKLAVESFTYDRLHADPDVSKEDADQAKRDWVRRVFATSGGHQRIFGYPGDDGDLAGFLIVKVDADAVVIDLLAVAESKRGRGIGRSLVSMALKQFPNRRFLRAGTQRTNEPAARFYASLGMRVVKTQRTLHKDAP